MLDFPSLHMPHLSSLLVAVATFMYGIFVFGYKLTAETVTLPWLLVRFVASQTVSLGIVYGTFLLLKQVCMFNNINTLLL